MKFSLRDQIILRCYEITKEYSFFHEWFRLQILRFQLPFINLYFRITCSDSLIKIIPRHSLTEESGFNLFFSDIDLTFLVKCEKDIPHLLKCYDIIKKVVINLGEPEVLTQKEFTRISANETVFFSSFWTKIFQLRKVSWQIHKAQKPITPLEKMKVERGIQRSLSKLHSDSLQIQLSNIFEVFPIPHSSSIEFPYSCEYLKFVIEIKSSLKPNALIATTALEASAFVGLLPGNQYQEYRHEIPLQRYLLIREISLSTCQQRLLYHQGKETLHLEDWIKKLESCLIEII